ncbi:LA_2272 family surface repeat-containing protein [Candidatus Neomarinimicrobiota bacterium]
MLINKHKYALVSLTILLSLNFVCYAQTKPVQIALFAPAQIHPEETEIAGFRWNIIYGKNTTVSGVDVGFVNHTTAGSSIGFQGGFIGINDANFTGWQDNTFNITKGNFEGLQAGLYNYANNATGLQLGLINYARNLHGVQIGLVNIIEQGGAFPFLPIINWSF